MKTHSLFRRTILAAAMACAAQVSAQAVPLQADAAPARTAKAFETARQQGPLALRAFLAAMPKGSDLPSHLGGTVYAESWIAQATTDGLCVDAATLTLIDQHVASAPIVETADASCRRAERPTLLQH